jgi:hypothetical protein
MLAQALDSADAYAAGAMVSVKSRRGSCNNAPTVCVPLCLMRLNKPMCL